MGRYGLAFLAQTLLISTAALMFLYQPATGLCQVDTARFSSHKILESSAGLNIPDSLYSKVEHTSFPRVVGGYKDGSAYAIFSTPHNPRYRAPSGDLPPPVVEFDGGPNAHATLGLSMVWQY